MIKTFLLAGYLLFPVFEPSATDRIPPASAPDKENRQMLLILDSDYLSCPSCGEDVVRFVDKLKAGPVENIIGIVTHPPLLEESDSALRILRRQIEGFRLGLHIEFPFILIDRSHVKPLAFRGASLVVLDAERGQAAHYLFPLPAGLLDVLLSAER